MAKELGNLPQNSSAPSALQENKLPEQVVSSSSMPSPEAASINQAAESLWRVSFTGLRKVTKGLEDKTITCDLLDKIEAEQVRLSVCQYCTTARFS